MTLRALPPVYKVALTEVAERRLREEFVELHEIADRARPRFRRAFLGAISQIRDSVTLRDLREDLEAGRFAAAIRGLQQASGRQLNLAGFKQELTRIVEAAGTRATEFLPQQVRVQIRFDLVNPFSVQFINEQSARLVREIDATTRQGLSEAVRIAFEEGVPPRELAREIRQRVGLTARQQRAVANFRRQQVAAGVRGSRLRNRVDRFTQRQLRLRAENIARTETINAANAGQEALWQQARDEGLLEAGTRKVWITTPDDRTCPICRPIPRLNEGGIPLDGQFRTPVGPRSRPTAHPRCRCAMRLAFPAQQ